MNEHIMTDRQTTELAAAIGDVADAIREHATAVRILGHAVSVGLNSLAAAGIAAAEHGLGDNHIPGTEAKAACETLEEINERLQQPGGVA